MVEGDGDGEEKWEADTALDRVSWSMLCLAYAVRMAQHKLDEFRQWHFYLHIEDFSPFRSARIGTSAQLNGYLITTAASSEQRADETQDAYYHPHKVWMSQIPEALAMGSLLRPYLPRADESLSSGPLVVAGRV